MDGISFQFNIVYKLFFKLLNLIALDKFFFESIKIVYFFINHTEHFLLDHLIKKMFKFFLIF